MNKIEFLAAVSAKLTGLLPEEIKGHINFLSEMIDDRVEEGLTEAEAVKAMGEPDQVASAILSDAPNGAAPIAKATPRKKKRIRCRSVLLAITSPIWASLLLAVVVTLFSIIVALGTAGLGLLVVGMPCWWIAKYLFLFSLRGAKIVLHFVAPRS